MADMEQTNFDPDGVGVMNGAFFGLPFTLDDARLVLISVPWDVTVSYGSGTVRGPEVILEASTQLDFYDPIAPGVWKRGIATLPLNNDLAAKSELYRHKAERVIAHLEAGGSASDHVVEEGTGRINEACREMNGWVSCEVERLLQEGHLVGLVGGDHSTPYGLIRTLGRHHDNFGILHIDAHRDLRIAYEGFEYSHASIMYNVLKDTPQVSRLVQVGVRDFCEQEAELARSDGRIRSFEDRELAEASFEGVTWKEQCRRIVDTLPEKVYVSFDIDGLSPDNCPHTGTPVSGGLSFNEAVMLLKTVVDSGRRIIGFDVVEVAPAAAEDDRIDAITGARVLWKLACLALKSDAE